MKVISNDWSKVLGIKIYKFKDVDGIIFTWALCPKHRDEMLAQDNPIEILSWQLINQFDKPCKNCIEIEVIQMVLKKDTEGDEKC